VDLTRLPEALNVLNQPKEPKDVDEPQSPKHFSSEDEEELTEISTIFKSAVEDVRIGKRREATTAEETQVDLGKCDDTKPPRHFDRYTPALQKETERVRKVFAKLRSFQADDTDKSSPQHAHLAGIRPERIVELVVRRESEKIDKELQGAISEGRGDIGIWRVCEDRIFGMLEHLGLKDDSNDLHPWFSGRRRKASRKLIKAVNDSNAFGFQIFHQDNVKGDLSLVGPLDIPPAVPALPIVSAMYPDMLLRALRLLHTQFPMSQLTSQLLPAIKARGRTSFVLGASTALYNELISFRWCIYSDIPHVVSLLEEMEETGVGFDMDTFELIDKIRRQRKTEREKLSARMQAEGRMTGAWWWDAEATRLAYRELAGSKKDGNGWIGRTKLQVRMEAVRKTQLRQLQRKLQMRGLDGKLEWKDMKYWNTRMVHLQQRATESSIHGHIVPSLSQFVSSENSRKSTG
jgi:hypothetical protein